MAEDTFPLPQQEGRSQKALGCLWQGKELVPDQPGHISKGKIHLLRELQMGCSSRMWEQPVLAN